MGRKQILWEHEVRAPLGPGGWTGWLWRALWGPAGQASRLLMPAWLPADAGSY